MAAGGRVREAVPEASGQLVRCVALVQMPVPLQAAGHPYGHLLGGRVVRQLLGGDPFPSVLGRLLLPAADPLGPFRSP